MALREDWYYGHLTVGQFFEKIVMLGMHPESFLFRKIVMLGASRKFPFQENINVPCWTKRHGYTSKECNVHATNIEQGHALVKTGRNVYVVYSRDEELTRR
jgi:hypothetical protein